MYTEKDYQFTKKQTSARLIAVLALAAAFLAVVIALIIWRQEVLSMVAGVAGFAVCYFLYGMKVSPWVKYRKFMTDMKNGQRKRLACAFVALSPETRFYDGVEVHELIAKVGEEKEDERLFYWDADKQPLPALEKEQKIEITSFGNFIVDLKAV